MDIASVYLNLASLLGTEIEVEGYYEWGEIRSLDHDRQSLSIVLPRYVWDQGLTDINHTLNIDPWVKLTVRGYLRQNRRGEPILDPIQAIVYTTEDINYRAIFIYDGDSITCNMCGDLIYVHGNASANYVTFKNSFFAYKFISTPLYIESSLIPPRGIGAKHMGFSITLNGVVLDYIDLARQTIWMLFYLFFVAPLTLRVNIKMKNVKNIGSARHIIWNDKPIYQSVVWIQDKEQPLLRRYLGPSIPGDYKRWVGKVKFFFAGQIRLLDDQERKIPHLPKDVRLTFASIDSIRLTKTITFQRPQDE